MNTILWILPFLFSDKPDSQLKISVEKFGQHYFGKKV